MIEWDYTPLGKPASRLREALDALAADPGNSLIRDAVIQRFEVTYGLCGKMLRRYLEAAADTPEEVERMTFPDLVRTGSEQGLLLSGWDRWFDYREARNLTSHTYDEAKALKVLESIPAFLGEAEHLYAELDTRSSADQAKERP